MGGEGSGRKPDPVKALMNLANKNGAAVNPSVSPNIYLPNLSGVRDGARKDRPDVPAGTPTLQQVTTTGAVSTNTISLGDGATGAGLTFDTPNSASYQNQIQFNKYTTGVTEFGSSLKSGFWKQTTANGNVTFFHLVTDGVARAIFGGGFTGENYRRYRILSDGKNEWGDGTNARDTYLYRSAASTLTTDAAFTAGTSVTAANDLIVTNNTDKAGVSVTGTRPTVALTFTGTTEKARFYHTFAGVTGMSTNTYFDGTNHQRDNTGASSVLFDVNTGATPVRLRYTAAGAGAITFTTFMSMDTGGKSTFNNYMGIGAAPSYPLHVKMAGVSGAVAQIENTTASADCFLILKTQSGTLGYFYARNGGNSGFTGAAAFTVEKWGGTTDILYVDSSSAGTNRVGINTAGSPSAKLHVIATTEQLRLGYNTTNYMTYTTGSTGTTTLTPVSSGTGNTDAMVIVDVAKSDISGTTAVLRLNGTFTPTADGNVNRLNAFDNVVYKAGNYNVAAGHSIRAIQNTVGNTGSGTITGIVGMSNYVNQNGTGTITNGYGYYGISPNASATKAITNYYHMYLEDPAKTGITTAYSIYSAGGLNYFAGDTTFNGDCKAATYHVGASAGADGTFTTVDGKTVTVTKGLITSIV